MFKRMKLGAKIGLGFTALLAIASALGGLAVWRTSEQQSHAFVLASEYVPLTRVATAVERNLRAAMFEIRGYGLSEDEAYLQRGREHLANLRKSLEEAAALVDRSPRLAELRATITECRAGVAEYEKLTEQTVEKVKTLAANRAALDAAARTYVQACGEYWEKQSEGFKSELTGTSTAQAPAAAADGATDEATRRLERLQKINLVNEVMRLGYEARLKCSQSQALRDPALIREANELFPKITTALETARGIARLKEELDRLDTVDKAAREYQTAMNHLLEAWLALQDLGNRRTKTAQAVLATAQAVAERGLGETTARANHTLDGLALAARLLTAGLAVAVVIGVLLAVTVTRSITRPINRIVAGLTEGANQVGDAAGQVSGASQQLAAGASEQASSLEETSSALEQMAAMTRKNAENAAQANELASQAREAAAGGEQIMRQLNDTMAGINESSEQVRKIIKVIEEIAFQTNLLALNAAVEAARAGEHGKGFAVVAEEVRNLAQRCATAAKDTTGLIEGAVQRSQQGTQVAGEVGRSLTAIVAQVTKVSDLISGIAQASHEQAQGVDQVNTAVAQMDKVTQQTAAGAEEAASAAEELSSQAETLRGMVRELETLVNGAHSASASASKSDTSAPSRRQRVGGQPVRSAVRHASPGAPVPSGAANEHHGLQGSTGPDQF